MTISIYRLMSRCVNGEVGQTGRRFGGTLHLQHINWAAQASHVGSKPNDAHERIKREHDLYDEGEPLADAVYQSQRQHPVMPLLPGMAAEV